jgi:hypothetical protein
LVGWAREAKPTSTGYQSRAPIGYSGGSSTARYLKLNGHAHCCSTGKEVAAAALGNTNSRMAWRLLSAGSAFKERELPSGPDLHDRRATTRPIVCKHLILVAPERRVLSQRREGPCIRDHCGNIAKAASKRRHSKQRDPLIKESHGVMEHADDPRRDCDIRQT